MHSERPCLTLVLTIPYIGGDGIDSGNLAAAQHVIDAAVRQAYVVPKGIHLAKFLAGEKHLDKPGR